MQTSARLLGVSHLTKLPLRVPGRGCFLRLTAHRGQSLLYVHRLRLMSGHGRPAAVYEGQIHEKEAFHRGMD